MDCGTHPCGEKTTLPYLMSAVKIMMKVFCQISGNLSPLLLEHARADLKRNLPDGLRGWNERGGCCLDGERLDRSNALYPSSSCDLGVSLKPQTAACVLAKGFSNCPFLFGRELGDDLGSVIQSE